MDQNPGNEKVHFGVWVTVERDDGSTALYRIVGADELDQHEAYISIDAPVARALLGKTVDDDVAVKIADTVQRLTILAVEYRD